MRQKKILVAGGAGFVGSNLCEFLVARGDFVIAWDNLCTGSKKNITHLLKHQNFQFIKADILKPLGFKVDEIYHLASPASPFRYQSDPIGTWKANTLGTLNLLEMAKKYRAVFLFASTSEIYGDPLIHPQTEKYYGNVNPVGLRACYNESKRAGESLCMDYHRVHHLDIKIVRIFNTYGPRMDKGDGRVISNFIVQALSGKPLTVYGTGRQTRSFVYIDDLVTGLIKAMHSPKNLTGPVNLGNPKEFTILELAKKIVKLTKSSSRTIYKPLPKDDPKHRKPNVTLAKKRLGWRPHVDLQAGLKQTIEYFKAIV